MKITKYHFGDVVLIHFPFSDLRTLKKRPCVIIKDSGQDVLVIFISSRVSNRTKEDILLEKDKENNLAVDSIIKTWKINNIHKGLIVKKIGGLNDEDKSLLKNRLRENIDNL